MYIVMTRSAHVSGRARDYGPYKYSALVELDPVWAKANPGREPKMISPRARGVRRIVRSTPGLYAGTTMRSAFVRETAELQEECDRLNNGWK